jgi:DNA polymerase-1
MGLENVQLHLIDTVDDAGELMRWLSTKDRIAIDVEATGLDVTRDRVRLVQVGDAMHGWAIPVERWLGVFDDLVKRYEGEYIIHNMPYDWPIMANSLGIELPRHRCHDTRIMAHILRPDLSTALKRLSALHIDPVAAQAQRKLDDALSQKNGWTWATVPVTYEPYWTYGALDPVLTYRLDDIFRKQVMDTAPLAYDIERAAAWVTVDMSRRGIRIDREYTTEHIEKFERYVKDVEQWCVDNYGVKPGQTASIVETLASFGYEFDKKTKSGAISLDKEVLGAIDHPLAQAVLSRRQTQKVTSTYLRNFLELADDDDLIHPRINVLGFKQDDAKSGGYGVRTGRMSISDPSLQNLSRLTDHPSPGNAVRNCLIAREGNRLVLCDFSQIEARLIAHLTEDPGFIAAFSEGDFFVNVTRTLWNDPTIGKKDARRQSVKNAIYARSYGAGVEKFATTAGVPLDAAQAMYAQLDVNYPGWRQFTKTLEATARHRYDTEGTAYVRSFMTGKRHVVDPDKLYVLTNYLIQGTAAEIFKMKLGELAAAGLDQYMVVPVHDEIILDVPNEHVHDVCETLGSVMNDKNLLRVPLEATVSVKERWGGPAQET